MRKHTREKGESGGAFVHIPSTQAKCDKRNNERERGRERGGERERRTEREESNREKSDLPGTQSPAPPARICAHKQ